MYIDKFTGYMGSSEDYKNADIVILGAPMDFTVSFRPGTRNGPHQIRTVSVGLEEYSPDLDRDLSEYRYYDLGDVAVVPGRIKESLRRIGEAVGGILDEQKFPLLLGGEHLVTLPAVEKAAYYHPGLAVVHFDAHADLRDEYLGEKLSHATVMRRVTEIVGGKSVFQLGIRSGAREEFAFAQKETNLYTGVDEYNIQEIVARLAGRPVYITLDIDVLDPAFAPGTGTPEPGGCFPRDIINALKILSQLRIVAFDLVEVCPMCDPGDCTSLLAAKLVREAILLFGRNLADRP